MTLKDIRIAIISKISCDSNVQARLGNPARIYNVMAPSNTLFPYALVRTLTDTPSDTIGGVGNSTTVSIDIYTQSSSEGECEDLNDIFKSILHRQPLTVTGCETVYVLYEFGEPVGDPDPTVQHFTSRYRVRYMVKTMV